MKKFLVPQDYQFTIRDEFWDIVGLQISDRDKKHK